VAAVRPDKRFCFVQREDGSRVFCSFHDVLPQFQDRIPESIYVGSYVYCGFEKLYTKLRTHSVELYTPQELADFEATKSVWYDDSGLFRQTQQSCEVWYDSETVPHPTP
jgi:hypothetical protein